jgi:hypothetical protein
VKLLPLYTSDEGGSVFVNSDSWLWNEDETQIAVVKAKGVQPGRRRVRVYAPDGFIVEYPETCRNGSIIHVARDEPSSAPRSGTRSIQRINDRLRRYTETNCKVLRAPTTWPALEKEGIPDLFGDRILGT